jgi:hypothetical protein
MRIKVAVLVCLLSGALALSACRGDSSNENADQFRENAAALDAGVRLDPSDADMPGIVSGSVPTAPGGGLEFTFSFGPDADDITDDFPERDEVVHFRDGDEFYSSMSNAPSNLNVAEQSKRFQLELALQDAACEAAAGKKCESSAG